MRLEFVPVVFGVLVLLVAAGIIYDALSPEAKRPFRERRRRQRAELDKPGEWMVALGMICLGAALIGNELWRWTTIAVISGVVLLVLGAIMNRTYLREMLLFRGASRRTEENEIPAKPDQPNLRIR
jgi:phosphatidylglycerophosphate synthase